MATGSLGTLTVDLVAKIAGFSDGLNKSERELKAHKKKIERELKELGEFYGTAGKIAAGAFTAAAAAMIVVSQRTAEAVDSQSELATALNTSYNSLTNLGLVGKVVGVDVATMNMSVTKLNDSIADLARGGTGDAAKKLRELGLTAKELSALDADQRIATIAERIKDVVPASQQAAFAVDILGKTAGQALLNIDTKMLAEAAAQAKLFGVSLSDIDAAQIGQIADSMDTIGLAMDGIGNSVALSMAPIFAETAKQITGAATEMEGFRNVGIGVRSVLVNIVALAANAADLISKPFRIVGAEIETAFAEIFEDITNAYVKVVHGINAIPGVNLDEHEKAAGKLARSAGTAVALAKERIDSLFTDKLWGNQLRDWVQQVDNASWNAARIAAENAAKARKEMRDRLAAEGGNSVTMSEKDIGKGVAVPMPEKSGGIVTSAFESSLKENNALAAEYGKEMDAAAQVRREEQMAADAFVKEQRTKTWSGEMDYFLEKNEKEISSTQQMLGNLSTLMNSHSKKAFELGKVAAIAGAIVNTALGATKALGQGGIFGPALAATVIAAGMVQIQSIRAQSFSGGGSPAVSNTSAVNSASQPVGDIGGGSRNVYLHGIEESKQYSGRDLLRLINDELQDGGTLRLANV